MLDRRNAPLVLAGLGSLVLCAVLWVLLAYGDEGGDESTGLGRTVARDSGQDVLAGGGPAEDGADARRATPTADAPVADERSWTAQVVDEKGEPFARRRAMWTLGEGRTRRGFTDDAGVLTIQAPAGRRELVLWIAPLPGLPRGARRTTLTLAPGAEAPRDLGRVVAGAPPLVVAGRVVDVDGVPVAGARVHVRAQEGALRMTCELDEELADTAAEGLRTNRAGEFALSAHATVERSASLEIRASDGSGRYRDASRTVTLGDGAVLLTLDALRLVAGRVEGDVLGELGSSIVVEFRRDGAAVRRREPRSMHIGGSVTVVTGIQVDGQASLEDLLAQAEDTAPAAAIDFELEDLGAAPDTLCVRLAGSAHRLARVDDLRPWTRARPPQDPLLLRVDAAPDLLRLTFDYDTARPQQVLPSGGIDTLAVKRGEEWLEIPLISEGPQGPATALLDARDAPYTLRVRPLQFAGELTPEPVVLEDVRTDRRIRLEAPR